MDIKRKRSDKGKSGNFPLNKKILLLGGEEKSGGKRIRREISVHFGGEKTGSGKKKGDDVSRSSHNTSYHSIREKRA